VVAGRRGSMAGKPSPSFFNLSGICRRRHRDSEKAGKVVPRNGARMFPPPPPNLHQPRRLDALAPARRPSPPDLGPVLIESFRSFDERFAARSRARSV